MALLFNRPTPPVTNPDQRAVEILELAHNEGISLRVSIDLILWLEDHGMIVDLRTGIAMKVAIERVTPSGMAVTHLLTPPSEREVEQTIEGLFTVADDGDLQAAIEDADRDICFYDYDDGSIEDDHDWIRRGC